MARRKLTAACVACSLLASGLSGCSGRPEQVLGDEQAASLLADLHIADAYGTLEGGVQAAVAADDGDSVRKVLRQSVMARHGVSEMQLDTTLGWYGRNLDKYEEMYESVISKIDEKRKSLQQADSKKSDMPALWPYGNMQRIQGSGDGGAVIVPFDIPGRAVGKGGRLRWEGKTVNVREPVELFMAVDYTDGSTGYVQRSLTGDGRQSVVLQTDTGAKVRRAYGCLRVRQSQPLLLDSVSLGVLPFDKTSYYEIHSAKRWTPK